MERGEKKQAVHAGVSFEKWRAGNSNFVRVPGVIGKGYCMDAVGEEVEREVNGALPGYPKFHGVNKIVVRLGPPAEKQRDYVELLGVGLKQWNEFDVNHYVNASDSEKRQLLRDCVIQVYPKDTGQL